MTGLQMRPRWAGPAAVLAGAAMLVAAVLWGQSLARQGVAIFLGAPPFVGLWEARWTWALLLPLAVAVLLVTSWVPATETLPWRVVLTGSFAAALAWPVSLQLTQGWTSLYTVLGNRRAYLPTARSIDSPARFLDTFVERIHQYPTHVKGHPPGATLAHWVFDALGGGRSDVLTAGFLLIAASAAPAALIACDRVAGRDAARRAAGFVGLAPAAIWIASSPDAMFMGVLGWAIAFGAVAATAERPTASLAGFASGLLAGASLSLSYGSLLLLAPLWVLAAGAAIRRRWAALAAAAAGAVVVPLVFVLAGFDWLGGLAGTRTAYLAGVAPGRPARYFLLSNLAVTAVSVGPAALAGMAWLRDRKAWLLVGGAIGGVVAANLSLMSKGEVERIWLPAVPVLVLATAAIRGRRHRRLWSGAQLAVALALQVWLRSPW